MRHIYLLFLAAALVACHQSAAPQNAAPAKPEYLAIKQEIAAAEQVQVIDIQTLTENHNILLIRVAGNNSKLSEATKSRLATLTQSFNAGFDALKTALTKRTSLIDQLKKLDQDFVAGTKKLEDAQQALAQISAELKPATEAVDKVQEDYNELSRQFAQMIETVKSERAHLP